MSLNHNWQGLNNSELLFVTHDPPFVKYANPDIPLIQSIEHPLIEAIEFMDIIKSQLDQKGQVPEFAIIERIAEPYCRQALFEQFMKPYYDFQEKFYYSMERTGNFNYSYRYLFRRK